MGGFMKKVQTIMMAMLLGLSSAITRINAEELQTQVSENNEVDSQELQEEVSQQDDTDKTSPQDLQITTTIETTVVGNDGKDDNDELFAEYVDHLFSSDPVSDSENRKDSKSAANALTENDLILYTSIYEKAVQIASGEISSTVISFSGADLGDEIANGWTAEELGVPIIVNGAINSAAVDAAEEKFNKMFSINKVIHALIADYPYEFYWYDKTKTGGTSCRFSFSANSSVIKISDCTLSMAVAKAYALNNSTGSYVTDTSRTQAASNAVSNANSIIDSYSTLNDFPKLSSYKEKICELVTYNFDALEEGTLYGDPWQIIYVFDNNPDTNVVCEGYAKAFQYLCDRSVFKNNIKSRLISGQMTYDGGGGGHMWNVVTMDDQRNYLVDVTNCDEGTAGADDLLFLKGYTSGSFETGYTFCCHNMNILYQYSQESALEIFTVEELTLSDTDYEEITEPQPGLIASGYCGELDDIYQEGINLTWQLTEDHILTVTGSGNMGDWFISYTEDGMNYVEDKPWTSWKSDIEYLVVEEGVTSIGGTAFKDCENLRSVSLPESVDYIGDAAFMNCSNLTDINLPVNLQSVQGFTFSHCQSLTKFTAPEGLESIEEDAFERCTALKYLDLGNVENIDQSAFAGCTSLKVLTIPDSITCIENAVFSECSSLETVTIPVSVLAVDKNAFSECTSIKDVYYAGTEAQWADIAIDTGNDPLTEAIIHFEKKYLDISYVHLCSIQNNLALKYRFDKTALEQFDSLSLHIERQTYTGSGEEYIWETAEICNYTTDSDKYCFAFRDIAAAEMGEEIHATLYAVKDGVTYVSGEDIYSIKQYAYNMINRYGSSTEEKDQQLCTLLVDMLNYGSQAQLYFGRNTGHLVNADLTPEQQAFGTQDDPVYNTCSSTEVLENANVKITSKTLSLNSTVDLKVFMEFDTEPGDNTKIVFRYETVSGGEKTETISRDEWTYKSADNKYIAVLNKLAAPDFNNPVQMTVYDGDEQISSVYWYSIETYAYNMSRKEGFDDLKVLLSAMMKYSNAARVYFQ